MTLDYLSIISDETSRIARAYEDDRFAAVPWSDRWTIGTVARHVAGTHHVVAEIVRRRPDANFGLFGELQAPAKDSPRISRMVPLGDCLATGSTLECPRRRRMLVLVCSWVSRGLVGSPHGTRSRHPPLGYRCGSRTRLLDLARHRR